MSESRVEAAAKWRKSRCQFTRESYPYRQCIAGEGHPGPHRDLSGPIPTDEPELQSKDERTGQ